MEETFVSVGRACWVIFLHRSVWYYQSCKDDREVINKLQEYADRYPTRGFDEYYSMIRNENLLWNRKRVLSVYRLMKLSMRRKRKRRLPARIKQPLEQQVQSNKVTVWTL